MKSCNFGHRENEAGRPRTVRTHLASELRKIVLTGDFGPSDRFPARTVLEKNLKANPVTLQRAVEELVDDGFLWTKGRSGTFVCRPLPHEHRSCAYPFADRWPEKPVC